MELLSTQEAAARAGGVIQLRQIQQACRQYHDPERAGGLRCEKLGKGPHASYWIDPADLDAYLATPPKRGWPKGKPRGRPKKNAADGTGGAGDGD